MINLNKKYTTFILIIVFFVCSRSVFANFEITEIMYDLDGTDSDREWVEVKNVGSYSVDLSKWYLFSDNSKHSLVPQGNSIVPSGSYVIIAQNPSKFNVDWPNFSGLLFDSSWTGLNNESDSLSLKDPDLNIQSPISFNSSLGGDGDGNSLQLIGSLWKAASPTPGLINEVTNDDNSNAITQSSSSVNTDISNSNIIDKKELENPKIVTQIITSKIVTAGVPFIIDHVTIGLKKEKIVLGKFTWNFGDGMLRESTTSDPFEYIYKYPGEYVLNLSYCSSVFCIKPDATDRIIVKVISSGVNIISIGSKSDPYIEIENNSNYEIALYNWIIKGSNHTFTIPQGMIILANKKLKLSPIVTGFDFNDLSSVSIIDKTGQVFSTYPNTNYSLLKNYSSKNSPNNYIKSDSPKIKETQNTQEVINLNDLGSSAESSSNLLLNNKLLIYFGLASVILIGIASVVLFRRKNNYPDYIEKEVSANDMVIIE